MMLTPDLNKNITEFISFSFYYIEMETLYKTERIKFFQATISLV